MGFYQDYSEHGMCLRTEQPVVSSYVFVYSIDRETILPQKKSDPRFYTKAAIYGRCVTLANQPHRKRRNRKCEYRNIDFRRKTLPCFYGLPSWAYADH